MNKFPANVLSFVKFTIHSYEYDINENAETISIKHKYGVNFKSGDQSNQ